MIDLKSEFIWQNAWQFPLQTPESRRDVFIGGLWLLVPGIGWLLNMGHRVRMVHYMQHGLNPWPAWQNPLELLRHGALTFLGMVFYGSPGVALIGLGVRHESYQILGVGLTLWLVAVVAIPGYMSHYCFAYDWREIFNPLRALSRVREGGFAYWKAWSIALCAMAFSFVGLLGFGVGFLFSSVWFWQVAAFSFAQVFTKTFDLHAHEPLNSEKRIE